MYTELDKAIVAVVMGVIVILNTLFHENIGVSQEAVNTVVALLTPVLIYLIPNKEKKS